MKKAIITGANGTVSSALKAHLESQGITAVPWNRNQIPIDDYDQMEAFLQQEQPDTLFHLAVASQPTGRDNEGWLVNYEWSSELAWLTRQLGITFLFTSTVMVYTDDAKGPFTPDTIPDAQEGYGSEKLQAEQRIWQQNPQAIIARLGWQIGSAPGTNNMIDFFAKQMAEHGVISASRQWLPACSFLEDTAVSLHALAQDNIPSTYLINSNTKWNFYQIATALNEKHGRVWQVEPNDDFVYDQRMLDHRVNIPPLEQKLPMLGT